MSAPTLESATVVVTGGAGGLARAVADEFPSDRWRCLTPARAECDVTSEASVAAYFGGLTSLSVLIANAGRIDDHALASLSEASWDEVLRVNLDGAFLCARAALPLLRENGGGQILFIGSRAGRRGGHGNSHYAAAKAALIGLAQSLAREGGAENIRCNVILPGFLETPMTVGLPPRVVDAARADHVLGRFNTVAEAARGIAFVASLAHVSGQVFQFDSRIDRWT